MTAGEWFNRTKFGRAVWLYVFNMPDPKQAAEQQPKPVAPAADGLDAWASASAKAAEPVAPERTAARPGDSMAWRVSETSRSKTNLKRVVRVVIILVIAFAVITGVRTWFTPQPNPNNITLPAAVTFPYAASSGVASRFAVNYFTWDEANGANRAAALAQDIANGGDGSTLGWDGKGVQTAADPVVVAVDVQDKERARLTVSVTVTPFVKDEAAKKWNPGKPGTLALEVPIAITNGRPAVVGNPGTVGMPKPGKLTSGLDGREDTDLTKGTKDYAKTFFTNYGKDTDLGAITAPDARIVGLGGSLVFKELTNWSVLTDGGDTRLAAATVRWTAGGASLDQSFTVTLIKVTGAGAERWQISRIQGGN